MPTNPHLPANNLPTPGDRESLGGQLRAMREALGRSQAEVAAALSQARGDQSTAGGGSDRITAEAVGNWERNRRRPRRRQDVLEVASFFHKCNPALVTMEMIAALVATYDPAAPLTADERVKLLLAEPRAPEPTPARDPDRPFITGRPVMHPRHFFGRAHELQQLCRLWAKRPLESAAIVGPRLSGKTSLLYYLEYIHTAPVSELRPSQTGGELPHPERYRWCYVDFRNPLMGRSDDLLRRLLIGLRLPAPQVCSIEDFVHLVSTNLYTPAIVLFDDIGVAVQRYPGLDYNLWNGLRSLATTQTAGNLAFAVTSSELLGYSPGHQTLGSPFFNIFSRTISLGPLSEPEARELIASSPLTFPAADVEWILDSSGRWPALLQILCRERLTTLENGVRDDSWRTPAQVQLGRFRHLLTS